MLDALAIIHTNNTALQARFAHKMEVNPLLNRQLVSFQANKNKPGYRWFKYKEGFSEPLIQHFFDVLDIRHGHILDPFAGTGTALFVARERGIDATGIEVLPVGCEIMAARQLALEHGQRLQPIIDRWRSEQPWTNIDPTFSFTHLRITQAAFSPETQYELEQYLSASYSEDHPARQLLQFAAMCVLEAISYTRKDGQYLRWDYRSGRRQGKKQFDKGTIYSFEEAIVSKLNEIYQDLHPSGYLPGFFGDATVQPGTVNIIQGSCLNILPTLQSASFDALITSPPYVNRYDYTRTYALELALLGVDEEEIKDLRQTMVACTVENRKKPGLAHTFDPILYHRARSAFDNQTELQAILDYLDDQKETGNLNNAGIPRMVRNYFFEMALVIFEMARVLKPGAPLVMVNDNVRYSGAVIPVDLILSAIAEQAGFDVEVIWILPTGKGNSSQQMGIHGREEVRKCIYVWRRIHRS